MTIGPQQVQRQQKPDEDAGKTRRAKSPQLIKRLESEFRKEQKKPEFGNSHVPEQKEEISLRDKPEHPFRNLLRERIEIVFTGVKKRVTIRNTRSRLRHFWKR
jgi:hypothetical protein